MIELRPYQRDAVASALKYLSRPGGGGYCLFMEQRTGKTPTACALIEELKPQTVLIACPVVAISVWEEHLSRYSMEEGREIRVMNFESIWGQRRKLKRHPPDLILVDESHRIKSRAAKQSKALRSLGRLARWRIAMTGTPLEGKIWDAWAQYDFIDPEVFGEWSDFKERYLIYGGFKGKKIVGTQNEDDFQLKFRSRFYRVLLEDVKAVPTEIEPPNVVRFDLVESRPMYESMEKKFWVELEPQYVRVKVGGKFVSRKKRIIAPRVITQIMKLHQLSGGFILDEEKKVHRFGDEKLAHTGALMLRLGKVPIVVVVRFIPELYRIAALVRAMGRTVTMVSGSHKFEGFDTDVIVIQIRAGVSIDLSRAEEVIFHSWGHSFLDYDQAKFRIRSYTSTRARYHYLVAKNTIDEDLFNVIETKGNIVSVVLNKHRRKN